MSQLTIDLALDGYRSTLSQSYNGGAGSIYVNNVPSVSFPTGKKVLLTIEPEKANMQVVELDGWDSVAKTLNCTGATVKRGEGANYSATDHSIGSEVKISIPYDARDDIKTAINSKVNTNSTDTDTGKFADATARDAYFTSPVNGNSAYLTAEGKRTDYVGGAWVDRATGSTPNASTTVAGKVEKATSGEVTAGTSTGGTGAELFVGPAELKTVTDGLTTSINTKPSIATNATASTGSNTTDSVNPLQLKRYFGPEPSAGTTYTASSASGALASLTSANGTYTQNKIGTIKRTGTYTVAVTISAVSFGTQGYAKIYKNGVAFSSEQTNSSGASPATVARDLAYTEGDTLSLWVKSNGGGAGTVTFTDLSIKYSLIDQNAFTLA